MSNLGSKLAGVSSQLNKELGNFIDDIKTPIEESVGEKSTSNEEFQQSRKSTNSVNNPINPGQILIKRIISDDPLYHIEAIVKQASAARDSVERMKLERRTYENQIAALQDQLVEQNKSHHDTLHRQKLAHDKTIESYTAIIDRLQEVNEQLKLKNENIELVFGDFDRNLNESGLNDDNINKILC